MNSALHKKLTLGSQADFLLITEVVEGGSLHNLIHSDPHTKLQHSAVLRFAAQVDTFTIHIRAAEDES